MPRGHDAGQRAAVRPAASLPVLHRGEAQRHERPGPRAARHARRPPRPPPSRSSSAARLTARSTAPRPQPSDWPAFRHDSRRGAAHRLPRDLPDAALVWRVKLGASGLARRSPSASGCSRRSSTSITWCASMRGTAASSGSLPPGGRIDSPPTCGAGCAAVRLGRRLGLLPCAPPTAQLAWRFRAAPEERLIGAFGQLESAWPVHGSVLVQNGIAYFAAGRSSHLDGGMTLYGLDAATGEIRCQAKLDGPYYTSDNIERELPAAHGRPVRCPRRPRRHDLPPQQGLRPPVETVYAGRPRWRQGTGCLDGTYFKRMPWSLGGPANYANLIVHDARSAYYVRMFDSLQGLTPTSTSRRAPRAISSSRDRSAAGKTIGPSASPCGSGPWPWPVRRLFAAGPPDVVDPKDPLGAFEGRKGGVLCVFDAASGEKTAEETLPSPPVFNGIAAARGRVYLAGEDGTLACFGPR